MVSPSESSDDASPPAASAFSANVRSSVEKEGLKVGRRNRSNELTDCSTSSARIYELCQHGVDVSLRRGSERSLRARLTHANDLGVIDRGGEGERTGRAVYDEMLNTNMMDAVVPVSCCGKLDGGGLR